jgi:signal transduction histidine kinase
MQRDAWQNQRRSESNERNLPDTEIRTNQLAAVLEAMTDAVIIFDDTGQVLHTNTAARLLFAPDAPAQATAYPLGIASITAYDEQDQPLPIERWPQHRILRGETLMGPNIVDIRIRRSDGYQRQLSVSGAPVQGTDGHTSGAICIFRDATERRQIEQRLRDTLHILLAVAEALMLTPDQAGDDTQEPSSARNAVAARLAELTCRAMGCERATLFGREASTDLLRPLTVAGFSPEQEQQWWARWRNPIRLSEHLDAATIARLRAGETLVLDLTQPLFSGRSYAADVQQALVAPLLSEGELIGILSLDHGSTTHNYTTDEIALAGAIAQFTALAIERGRMLHERAETQANVLALRAANQRMDEFITLAGHELRTPLTTIKANTQITKRYLMGFTLAEQAPIGEPNRQVILAGSPGQFARIRRLIERTENQIERLNQLVNDLLDVSHIQTGRLQLRLAPGDLVAITRQVVATERQAYPARTLTFTPPGEAAAPMYADTGRIAQVIRNYIANAVKYSRSDQPIAVTLRLEGTKARLLVHDAGPGLSAEKQQGIWERFHQAPGITQQSGSRIGLGLGLYISRTIIELHRGEVGVTSAPGAGSTFWFTLPLASNTPEHNRDP